MEYSKKTLKELQSLAKEKGIPKFSTYSKERLIQKLEKLEKKDVQEVKEEVKELEVPEIALPPIPETKIEVPPMPQPPPQLSQNPFIPVRSVPGVPGVPGGLTNPPKEVYNASINLKLDDEKKMTILKEISEFKNAERMRELQGMRDEIKELKDSFTMLSIMFMKRFGFLPLDQLPIFANARKREQEEKNKVLL